MGVGTQIIIISEFKISLKLLVGINFLLFTSLIFSYKLLDTKTERGAYAYNFSVLGYGHLSRHFLFINKLCLVVLILKKK